MNNTHTFTAFLKNKFDTIGVEDACMDAIKEVARSEQQKHYGEILEKPIDTAEIYNAL